VPIGRCASCKAAKTALAVSNRWGQLGNALKELQHQVTMAMLQQGKQAAGDAPMFARSSYHGPPAFAPWVCYAPTAGGRGHTPWPLPVEQVNAKKTYCACRPKLGDENFANDGTLYNDMNLQDNRLLASLFVESYMSLKPKICPFLTANKLHNGFNAVHLRNLDGRCYSLASVSAELNAEVKPFLGRDVVKSDICKMTSDYIRASIKSQGGNLKLPLVLCHDRQQKDEAARTVKDFKAVVFEGDESDAKKIDLLSLMKANTAVLSTGVLHSVLCCLLHL